MKSAVLFDLFGTLVPSPPLTEYRRMVNNVADILGVPPDDFYPSWMSINDGRLNGSFGSSEREIEHAAAHFGVDLTRSQLDDSVTVRRQAVRSWLNPKPGAVAVLEDLAESGCGLALVSDCVYDVPATWDDTELARFFPTTVFSCEKKVRKPDSRMYHAALDHLDVAADDAIFIGDGGSGELDGARSVGLDAFLLDDRAHSGEVLRVDVREWDGPSINDLSEVAGLLRDH